MFSETDTGGRRTKFCDAGQVFRSLSALAVPDKEPELAREIPIVQFIRSLPSYLIRVEHMTERKTSAYCEMLTFE